MKLKPGVSVRGIRPEIGLALFVADGIFKARGKELVVTAVTDGSHSVGSLHYVGLAADIRTRDIEPAIVELIAIQMREALQTEYDVVVESTHIHVEYQPKTR